jgi:hypothetical protein
MQVFLRVQVIGEGYISQYDFCIFKECGSFEVSSSLLGVVVPESLEV